MGPDSLSSCLAYGPFRHLISRWLIKIDSGSDWDFADAILISLPRSHLMQEQCCMDHSFGSGFDSDGGGWVLDSGPPPHCRQRCTAMQKYQLYQAFIASFCGIYQLAIESGRFGPDTDWGHIAMYYDVVHTLGLLQTIDAMHWCLQTQILIDHHSPQFDRIIHSLWERDLGRPKWPRFA